MRRLTVFLFRPGFSPAQVLGLAVICRSFGLTEWWIAIPLLWVWIMACSAIAKRVGAA